MGQLKCSWESGELPTDRVLTIRLKSGAYNSIGVVTWAPPTEYRVWATELDASNAVDEIELLERGVLSHLRRRYRIRWLKPIMDATDLRTIEVVNGREVWRVIERMEVTERTRRRFVDLVCVRGANDVLED